RRVLFRSAGSSSRVRRAAARTPPSAPTATGDLRAPGATPYDRAPMSPPPSSPRPPSRAVDHYAMLGVDPTADAEAVRLAYRRRIRAAHPDRAGATAHQTASAINAAWWVLRDPARRAAYDRQRQAARRPTGGPAVASRRPGPAAAGGSVLGRA